MNKGYLNDLSVKEMDMLKAGKAEVLGKEECQVMAGDGALWKCCINNDDTKK